MALRIIDNQLQMTRPVDMAADRARDIRQSGLTDSTLQAIVRDADNEMHTVRDMADVEAALVRTDAESESAGNQEQPRREKRGEEPADDALKRKMSQQLLNLPVSSGGRDEARRLDIRV